MDAKDITQNTGAIPQLKPIQTWWNGLYFRSRLEARWALFYDQLGIQYVYEREGFDLGEGLWYLPDFWLPEQEIFVEVKPVFPEPGDGARIKAEKLAISTGCIVAIAFGNIGSIDSSDWPNFHRVYYPSNGMTDILSDVQWGKIRNHSKYMLDHHAAKYRTARIDCEATEILIAYRLARAWRFEDSPPPSWELIKDAVSGKSYAKRPTGRN